MTAPGPLSDAEPLLSYDLTVVASDLLWESQFLAVCRSCEHAANRHVSFKGGPFRCPCGCEDSSAVVWLDRQSAKRVRS